MKRRSGSVTCKPSWVTGVVHARRHVGTLGVRLYGRGAADGSGSCLRRFVPAGVPADRRLEHRGKWNFYRFSLCSMGAAQWVFCVGTWEIIFKETLIMFIAVNIFCF